MNRNIIQPILDDLTHKIVLLTGPRQSGKTTLAKKLTANYDYFNYDVAEDRLALREKRWDREKQLIIFDEIHKMEQWKRWIKGIYDTEGVNPQLLVTGSAQLDSYRKVGDSLAGRYFQYRLHPLDVKEACELGNDDDPDLVFARLWDCSGFPEPFLRGDKSYYRRWRKSHLDIILRQDLLDLYAIRDIQGIENLVVLLKHRVGSTVSYTNLARDLDTNPNTVKRWLTLLENLYIIFRVKPYSKNIARSLLKEPKYYFYDHTYAEDKGARLENIVACALLKALHHAEDTQGVSGELCFLRTRDGAEIDFLTVIDNMPAQTIEVKWADDTPSPAFLHFTKFMPNVSCLQLVKILDRDRTYSHGLEMRALIPWLRQMPLTKAKN